MQTTNQRVLPIDATTDQLLQYLAGFLHRTLAAPGYALRVWIFGQASSHYGYVTQYQITGNYVLLSGGIELERVTNLGSLAPTDAVGFPLQGNVTSVLGGVELDGYEHLQFETDDGLTVKLTSINLGD